jgi:hypothetical protein
MASVARRTNHTRSPWGTSVSLEGQAPCCGNSRLARGCGAPLTHICLVRGPRTLIHPWCLTYSRDRGIKRSDTSWALGSKANPRHVDLLTRPGNLIPMLLEQPTIVRPSPASCMGCAGWPVSFLGTVPPAPVLPPPHPSKRDSDALRGVRPPTRRPSRTTLWRKENGARPLNPFDPMRPFPALCRHPRHCKTIPNTVGSYADGMPPRLPLCNPGSLIS